MGLLEVVELLSLVFARLDIAAVRFLGKLYYSDTYVVCIVFVNVLFIICCSQSVWFLETGASCFSSDLPIRISIFYFFSSEFLFSSCKIVINNNLSYRIYFNLFK